MSNDATNLSLDDRSHMISTMNLIIMERFLSAFIKVD